MDALDALLAIFGLTKATFRPGTSPGDSSLLEDPVLNTLTKPPRVTWAGRNNRTATLNEHVMKITERNGQFYGKITFGASSINLGPYTSETSAKNSLRRKVNSLTAGWPKS